MHGDSSKLNVLFGNIFYSSPLNWPIYICKRRTTFAKSYRIKLRCYWEHIREHIGDKGNLQSDSSPKSKRKTLGLLSACCAFSLVACYFARAQTYIIDAGGLFFFCLPGYPHISTNVFFVFYSFQFLWFQNFGNFFLF